MKIKSLLLMMLIGFGISTIMMAQDVEGKSKIKYRRSSLHTILLESDVFPKKDTIISAYKSAPFPDKYNNHTIGAKTFNPKEYALTDQERDSLKIKSGKGANLAKGMMGATVDEDEASSEEVPYVIDNYFKSNKIANQIVAKWFNRQEDGTFNMDLIGERGSYDASAMQLNIAKGSVRGTSALADAGEELIGNTFVVASKMNFVSNEPAARITRTIAYAAANQIPNSLAQMAAKKAADIFYKKTKDGYSVWTTSYLYKLKWNDSIAGVFYEQLWMDKSNISEDIKMAFDSSDIFELEFVGDEKAKSLVLFSGSKSEADIVKEATIRNVDKVFAKLQKKYDVFKTKTPLFSGEPLTAKIGMKEGLEGGENFEVLEQMLDPETGLTKYKRKGTITVDKKMLWDNRYNIADEPKEDISEAEGDVVTEGDVVEEGDIVTEGDVVEDTGKKEKGKKKKGKDKKGKDKKGKDKDSKDKGAKGNPDVDATHFKGGANYYSGMLIKQIK